MVKQRLLKSIFVGVFSLSLTVPLVNVLFHFLADPMVYKIAYESTSETELPHWYTICATASWLGGFMVVISSSVVLAIVGGLLHDKKEWTWLDRWHGFPAIMMCWPILPFVLWVGLRFTLPYPPNPMVVVSNNFDKIFGSIKQDVCNFNPEVLPYKPAQKQMHGLKCLVVRNGILQHPPLPKDRLAQSLQKVRLIVYVKSEWIQKGVLTDNTGTVGVRRLQNRVDFYFVLWPEKELVYRLSSFGPEPPTSLISGPSGHFGENDGMADPLSDGVINSRIREALLD